MHSFSPLATALRWPISHHGLWLTPFWRSHARLYYHGPGRQRVIKLTGVITRLHLVRAEREGWDQGVMGKTGKLSSSRCHVFFPATPCPSEVTEREARLDSDGWWRSTPGWSFSFSPFFLPFLMCGAWPVLRFGDWGGVTGWEAGTKHTWSYLNIPPIQLLKGQTSSSIAKAGKYLPSRRQV